MQSSILRRLALTAPQRHKALSVSVERREKSEKTTEIKNAFSTAVKRKRAEWNRLYSGVLWGLSGESMKERDRERGLHFCQ